MQQSGTAMVEKEAQSLIDYYMQHQSTPWAVYLSLATIVVSMGSAALTYIALRDAGRRHIRVEWNAMVDICIEHPQFIDIAFVSNYFNHDRELSFIYEAFCYKAWSLVEFISRTRLKNETGYNNIVQWIVAYHKVWLERNPYMFISKQFWDT